MASISDVLNNIGISNGTTETATRTGNDVLGKDAFLQLLVTQMRYQDPLNPTNDKEFLAQMAQFSALEQMQNLNTTFNKMQGFQLIGKTIIATQVDSVTGALNYVSGKVDAVSYINSKVYLIMGDEMIPIEDVESVVADGLLDPPDESTPDLDIPDDGTGEE